MPRVVHFEIHAEDPLRASRFYQQLFGWEFTKWDGPHDYWLITTGPADQHGINGGMLRVTVLSRLNVRRSTVTSAPSVSPRSTTR